MVQAQVFGIGTRACLVQLSQLAMSCTFSTTISDTGGVSHKHGAVSPLKTRSIILCQYRSYTVIGHGDSDFHTRSCLTFDLSFSSCGEAWGLSGLSILQNIQGLTQFLVLQYVDSSAFFHLVIFPSLICLVFTSFYVFLFFQV